jgi:hypothetical protein
MNLLLQFIRSLTEFSDESWKMLQPALTVKTYKKNELLLQEGQVCNFFFILKRAIAEAFMMLTEQIRTRSFL